MLALEPRAKVATSTGINPGIPQAVAAGIGRLDLAPFARQRAVLDWLGPGTAGSRAFIVFPVDTLASLIIMATGARYMEASAKGFIKPDPDDAARFQILRRLHIVYPTDVKHPTELAPGGRLPVVVLVHGQHSWFDGSHQIPSHEGYDYLQRELASYGIVSVSVDTNAANVLNSKLEMRAEMTLGALDELRAMDGDSASPFHGRLDFTRVGMMGHSRGGDAVVRAAIMNAARPPSTRYRIKAVCALAPTDYTGTSTTPITLEPAHTSFYLVVYGGLDGDVVGGTPTGAGGTGFRHYDRARTPKAMVFLDTCTHNRFNSVWVDSTVGGYEDSGLLASDLSSRVASKAHHHALANEYIAGVFRWQLLGIAALESLFDGITANSVGTAASIQWSFGKTSSAVTVLDDMEVSRATPGGNVTAIEATVATTHTNHQTGVLDVEPTSGSAVDAHTLSVPASLRDWSKFDQFTFRACADADVSSSASVTASDLPDFTLVFSDMSNQTAVVPRKDLQTPHRPLFHEVQARTSSGAIVVVNRTVIHLETFAVDLATALAGVDRSQMQQVVVRVPPGFGHHQFFDSFQLVKR